MSVPTRKKLIEVALPLDAINREASREKSIRHGHPSTLHLWWARRPLAACRAVIFASLVDDPSSLPENFPDESSQNVERQRLFRIIEELVKWENITNVRVLDAARAEIVRSCGGVLPPLYDPFAGGGSIPLEAQRLGLEAHASDLNPVPVLINKALIEFPPMFAGRPPVNPEAKTNLAGSRSWTAAEGLAEDIRYYGQWMCAEAKTNIGHLYPLAQIPAEYGGGTAPIIAWIWTRTVASPNPVAKGALVPLVRSFWLSNKPGKKCWIEPVVDLATTSFRFEVRTGSGAPPNGTISRNGGICILTGIPIPFEYIRSEGRAGRLGVRLMAVVADHSSGRVYLSPTQEEETLALAAKHGVVPDSDLPEGTLGFRVQAYGMLKHYQLFTSRQLAMLSAVSVVVAKAREKVFRDCGDAAYADAVALYLGEGFSKLTTFHNTLAYWRSKEGKSATGFGRQALAMTWDFVEANPFAGAGGDLEEILTTAAPMVVRNLPASRPGFVAQQDAAKATCRDRKPVFSTDPPYYDNVPYADLSDFFYVWLRQALGGIFPELFSTVLVPKAAELVADPFRHGGRERAKTFFETGLGEAFSRMAELQDPAFPVTIYYAFKQTESDDEDDGIDVESSSGVSTGWETMLVGLLKAGFCILGTWPLRTENKTRMRATGGGGSNALASSIVLVCRPRAKDAPSISRRDVIATLKRELPVALRNLQKGNVAPVDFAQSAIGPGMAVFSRYARVLETDGSPMTVRVALALINQVLDEVLAEQEGDFDAETRWALAWFEQQGFEEGAYGMAETLSTAKNVSISGLVSSGVVVAKSGKVRLLGPAELPSDWSPTADSRVTVWEMTHHLVRIYHTQALGDAVAAAFLRQLGGKSDAARDLAYRLFALAERRKRSADAQGYNALVLGWPELSRLAQEAPPTRPAGDSELNFN